MEKEPDTAQLTSRLASLEIANKTRKKKMANGTLVHLDPVEKSNQSPNSLRLAVTAKCWYCNGGNADPEPKKRIRECTVYGCPLHKVRPYQKKVNNP